MNKIILIGLLGLLLIGCQKVDCQKEYDGGYFMCWHESQFIDCSKPEINQTMEVIYYDEDVEGMIRTEHIEWFDLCNALGEESKQ